MYAREWTIITAPFFTWIIAFAFIWIGTWAITRRKPGKIRNAMAGNPLWKWSFLVTAAWMFGGFALMILGVEF